MEYELKRYKKTDSTSIQMMPLIRKKKSEKWFFKRKKFLIFFAVLCFFFLYYQIISYIQLSWDVSDEAKSKYLDSNKNKPSKEEIEFLREQISVYIPGVKSENSKYYIKMSDEFKCLHSEEIILFNQINDNYCDCLDGTDEPSTNACPKNLFYCVEHTSDNKPYIHSSRVNDGICDCCEGSDEWLNVTNHYGFDDVQINLIKKKSNVHITPCKNFCEH